MVTPNYIAFYDQQMRHHQTLQAAAKYLFSNQGTVAPNPADVTPTTCSCPISSDIYSNFNNIYLALNALRDMMLEISAKIPCGPTGGCVLSASFNILSANVDELSARMVWPDVDFTDGGDAEDSGGPDTGFDEDDSIIRKMAKTWCDG